MVSWHAATSPAAAVPLIVAFFAKPTRFCALMKSRGWGPEGGAASAAVAKPRTVNPAKTAPVCRIKDAKAISLLHEAMLAKPLARCNGSPLAHEISVTET